ncbi:MAG TPA: hypothetical protein VLA16_15955, partial [Ideonella sp.]|nr:hypothetical protein [Ideonella sp.]
MNLPSCSALAALACVAVLAGCASPREHATFVTKTSFSLVDVDTAPAGVSIAYDRVEGYIGPRFDDGTVFPVAGSLETNGEFMNRQIRQVYATGNAALLVTAKTLPAESNASEATTPSGATPADTSAAGVAGGATPQATPVATPPDNKVMFFGTGTSVGLKLGFT